MAAALTQNGSAASGAAAWRGVLSAFCASLIGIGLARFAYTPLLPAIVGAQWFSAATAAYLGAANLAGYLAGALVGRPLAARTSLVGVLRTMMVLASIAFFACAYPVSFLWFFAWRFIAGVAGGALMVLAAPSVLPHVPASRRGVAGGLVFMGVGAGVAASGTLVPLLLQHGLAATWIGLGVLSCVAALVGWGGWPGAAAAPAPAADQPHPPRLLTLRALYVEYALNAVGWVPHMIFLVDFVARGLGQGVAAGSQYWVYFGIGATAGPVLAGYLADRVGFGTALRLTFLIEAVAVAVPAVAAGQPALIVSSIVVGAFLTGTVALVLGRIHELMPQHPAQQKAAWSVATASFALCQAAAAYAMSFIFQRSGEDYQLLFVIGAGAMGLALALDLGAAMLARRP
jgi:predicted MFS family arabinose efflux permease